MSERIDELFAEYASAYARGERPQAPEYVARAGDQADELAGLIDAFLGRVPAPAADEQMVSLFEAWQANESPLLRLRIARGLSSESVAAAIVQMLGLDQKAVSKVKRYYGELESGLLQPERVDQRVREALAQTLGARITDLLGWRPLRPGFAAPASAAASRPMPAAMRRVEIAEQAGDEVDRLFGS